MHDSDIAHGAVEAVTAELDAQRSVGGKRLDRLASVPLYRQLKLELYRAVQSKKYPSGTRIPSERELCESYGVSRMTVRLALDEAVSEGWIERRHGRGTYVRLQQISQGLSRITSFGDSLESVGLRPSSSLVGWKSIPANMLLGTILDLKQPSFIINVQIVGYGNAEPMVFYDSFYDMEIGMLRVEQCERKAASGEPFSPIDLYGHANSIAPVRVEQTFEASLANGAVADALKVSEGVPVFMTSSVFFGRENRPLEYRRAYYRGDRYRFTLSREVL